MQCGQASPAVAQRLVPSASSRLNSDQRPQIPALIAAILICAGGAGPGRAVCIDYADYLHQIGDLGTWGYSRDVTVSGMYAYLAVDNYGIQVIDVSDPVSPEIVGEVDTPGGA